jgi:hypothetical protein
MGVKLLLIFVALNICLARLAVLSLPDVLAVLRAKREDIPGRDASAARLSP